MHFKICNSKAEASKFAKDNKLDHYGPICNNQVHLYMGHYENILLGLHDPTMNPVYGEFSVAVWNMPGVRWAVLVKEPNENFPWPPDDVEP